VRREPSFEVGHYLETKVPYQPVYIGIGRRHIAQTNWQWKKVGTPEQSRAMSQITCWPDREAIKCDITRSALPGPMVGIRNNTSITI
jgi:hypothetical protein